MSGASDAAGEGGRTGAFQALVRCFAEWEATWTAEERREFRGVRLETDADGERITITLVERDEPPDPEERGAATEYDHPFKGC